MSKYCLLLTATIAPLNVPSLKRDRYLDRENDYIKSLKFWLEFHVPIVFVENSNYDSEEINDLLVNKYECEYLKFESTNSQLGKGHGEAEIIEYAFNNSNIINEHDVVVKITGRLFVKNFSELIAEIAGDKSFFVISSFNSNLEFSDSKLIIAKKHFYTNYLIKECAQIDEVRNVYFEHIFARAVHRCLADGHKWKLPIKTPLFVGFSGTGNVEYRYSLFFVFKKNVQLAILKYLINMRP